MSGKDRVALVTGAGSGVGRASARALAEAGFVVALAGRRRAALEETKALLPPGRGLVIEADVADPASVSALFATIGRECGRLDLLFNNAGFVLPGPALGIGLVAGTACFWSATSLKAALRYDDSLDAFGVHGVGGIIGTLATGWFAFAPLSASPDSAIGGYAGGLPLLRVQAIAVLATIIWSGAASWVLLKITDLVLGLRVTRDQEREGLDIALHGEQVF